MTTVIALLGLEDCISMSNVDPILPNLGSPEYIGWIFNDKYPGKWRAYSLSLSLFLSPSSFVLVAELMMNSIRNRRSFASRKQVDMGHLQNS